MFTKWWDLLDLSQEKNISDLVYMHPGGVRTRAVEVPKKKAGKKAPATGACRRLLRRLHIRGFRVTGLALVVILRCDWPLCDLRFKSYEHFKLKIFLSRNLIYLTAKILRTVHWKCTSQIKTPAELRNFKLFTQIKSFKPICTPRKARRSQQTYHLNWMKLRWMVTSGWKRLKILSHKPGLKDKTSSRLNLPQNAWFPALFTRFTFTALSSFSTSFLRILTIKLARGTHESCF